MRLLALILLFPFFLSVPPVLAESRVPSSEAEITLSFAPVARQASRSVVNIYAKRVIARQVSPFADDPFFSQFFGLGRAVPRVENSLGSGVVVDSEGLVVSNHHVVGDASEIRVVLPDRREFDGEILLTDEEADIAVIKLVGATGVPALEFGDADAVEVGDLVLAIGNPFGVGQTVSSGIVSGLARTGRELGGATYFIQTDAPINPGNSGGALVDMSGRLIGINTSILTRSGGSNGIGFAIPANLVRQYVSQTVEGNTTFVRPWSGAAVQTIDHDMAAALGLDVPRGVLVVQVHPEGALGAAGLEEGDILLAIDGHQVNAPAELEYRLATLGPGREVAIAFLRNGKDGNTSVTLWEARGDVRPVQVSGRTLFDGLTIADVTPRLIEELDLPLDASGVIVLEVSRYSVRTGLRPGDRVLAVNGSSAESAVELRRLLARPGLVRELTLSRNGRVLTFDFRG